MIILLIIFVAAGIFIGIYLNRNQKEEAKVYEDQETNMSSKNNETLEESLIPDEYVNIEFTYLGSAKAKDADMLGLDSSGDVPKMVGDGLIYTVFSYDFFTVNSYEDNNPDFERFMMLLKTSCT